MDWLPDDLWDRAAAPDPAAARLSVPVCDPDVGAIAVLRLPDGREFYGVDPGAASRPIR